MSIRLKILVFALSWVQLNAAPQNLGWGSNGVAIAEHWEVMEQLSHLEQKIGESFAVENDDISASDASTPGLAPGKIRTWSKNAFATISAKATAHKSSTYRHADSASADATTQEGSAGQSVLMSALHGTDRLPSRESIKTRLLDNFALFLAGALSIIAIFALIAYYFQTESRSFLYLSLFAFSHILLLLLDEGLLSLLNLENWQISSRYFLQLTEILLFISFFKYLIVPKAPLWLFKAVKITGVLGLLLLFFPLSVLNWGAVVVFALLGIEVLVIVAQYLPKLQWGHSMSWFTSASVLASGLVFMHRYYGTSQGEISHHFMLLELFFVLVTTIAVSMRFGYNLRLESFRSKSAEVVQSNFVNSINHEFRTPMNVILGMADWLNKSNLGSKQRKILDTLTSYAEDLNYLLTDMLNLSQIEKGELSLKFQEVEIQPLLEKAIRRSKRWKAKSDVKVEVVYDKSLPKFLMGDPEILEQLVSHIVSNALKFTEHGSVKVEFNCILLTEKSLTLQIAVKDTGIGIARADLEEVRKAFRQLETGNTRRHSGTGLGLKLASHFAELMGGELQIDSTLGQGTKVYCSLKFQRPSPVISSKSYELEDRPKKMLGPLNILYAEDNPVNQKLLSMIIQSLGYQLDLAIDGQEACEKSRSKRYDLIFMDLQMPKMDGLEATKQILTSSAHRPVVIALTANSNAVELERCKAVGMNDFITKPFNLALIEHTISKWQSTLHYLSGDYRETGTREYH